MSKLLKGSVLGLALSLGAGVASAGDSFPLDDVVLDGAPDDFAAAVPEPTAVIAMGVGLATVAFALRRRNRN